MQTIYHGLPEFGLPLVAPDDPRFDELVSDIRNRPQPFPAWPEDEDLSSAAVLLNETGKPILALIYIWRNTNAQGYTFPSVYSDLGTSGTQLEVFSGREGVRRDFGTFILPGSKRLITREGMWGNNLDVLPDFNPGGGWVGMGSTGHFGVSEEIVSRELVLDLAILEDGLCAGPDESHAVESLVADLEQQRDLAREIAAALRGGASPGQAFDMVRLLVRRRHSRRQPGFPEMFARMAIHHLIEAEPDELVPWFERQAASTPLRLHRES